mgnify:CR=1 FL=1
MKLIALAASNSKRSLNRKLATYSVSLIDSAQVEVFDINNFDLLLFSEDKENELGQPPPEKTSSQKSQRQMRW